MPGSVAGFTPNSAAVFETTADPVVIGPGQIAELIAAARIAPEGRARLLLHPGRDDSLHEMVIALPLTSCDHPHINCKSGKSFLALSGQFAVMRCSQDGTQIEPIILSAGGWPGARMVRLRAAAWHTIIPLEGDTVFLETIVGPFTGNQWAEWFPTADDAEARAREVERFRALARARAASLIAETTDSAERDGPLPIDKEGAKIGVDRRSRPSGSVDP